MTNRPPGPGRAAIRLGTGLVIAAGVALGAVAIFLSERLDLLDRRLAPALACVAASFVLFGLMLWLTERIMTGQLNRALRARPSARDAVTSAVPRPRMAHATGFARLGPAALLVVLAYLALRRYG